LSIIYDVILLPSSLFNILTVYSRTVCMSTFFDKTEALVLDEGTSY